MSSFLANKHIIWLLLAGLVLVYLPYAFASYTISEFLFPTIVAALFHLSAFGLGAAIIPKVIPGLKTSPDRWWWGWALGLSIFGTAQFIWGQIGFFNTGTSAAVALSGFIGWIFIYRKICTQNTLHRIAAGFSDPWTVGAAVLVGLGIILNQAPPSFYDALTYHLGWPMQYLAWGRAVYTPHLYHSGSPILGELALSPLLAITHDAVVTNVAHAMSFGLMVILVGRTAYRFISKKSAGPAAFIFATMPVVFFSAVATKPDLFTALFELMALYGFFWLLEERTEPEPFSSLSPALMMGIGTGLALGTKFFALNFALVIWGALIVWPRWRRKIGFKHWLYSGIVASVVGGVWYIANWVHLGNPVYPFASSLFGGPSWMAHSNELFAVDGTRYTTPGDWLGIWRLPWDITFTDHSGFMNNMPGPLAPLLCLLLVFLRPIPAALKQLAVVVGLLTPLWLISFIALRYFPVLWFALALAAGYGLRLLLDKDHVTKALVATLAVFLSVASVMYSLRADDIMLRGSSRVVLGQMSGQEFLTEILEPYAGYRWANENLPASAVLLLVTDSRFAYLERKALVSGVKMMPLHDYLVRNSSSPDELLAAMKQNGATHFFIHHAAENRLRNVFGWMQWTPQQTEIYQRFLKGLQPPVYKDKHVTIYELPQTLSSE